MVVLYPLLIQLKFSYFTFLLGYPNSQLGFQTFPNIGQVASGSAFTYCYISKYFLPYIQYGHNLLVFGKKKKKEVSQFKYEVRCSWKEYCSKAVFCSLVKFSSTVWNQDYTR